jgi:uncharacterized protein YndB with AHSA1/START domain
VYYERSIDIDASPQTVWRIIEDVERWPEWTQSISEVTRLDSGEFRVGTRARIKQPRLPAVVWKVTALERGRSFTWVTKGPGATTTANHVVTPRDGGSTVTLSIDQSGVVGSLVARIYKGLTRRYIEMECEGLKRRAEQA